MPLPVGVLLEPAEPPVDVPLSAQAATVAAAVAVATITGPAASAPFYTPPSAPPSVYVDPGQQAVQIAALVSSGAPLPADVVPTVTETPPSPQPPEPTAPPGGAPSADGIPSDDEYTQAWLDAGFGPGSSSGEEGGGPPPRHGVLTHAQVMQVWVMAKGARDQAELAADIAGCESGYTTDGPIHNTAYPNRPNYKPPAKGAGPEYSVGLWQVNLVAHPEYTVAQMQDALASAKAIVGISNNGKSFSATNTNCYRVVTNSAYQLSGGTTAVLEAPPGQAQTVSAAWSSVTAWLAGGTDTHAIGPPGFAAALHKLFTTMPQAKASVLWPSRS